MSTKNKQEAPVVEMNNGGEIDLREQILASKKGWGKILLITYNSLKLICAYQSDMALEGEPEEMMRFLVFSVNNEFAIEMVQWVFDDYQEFVFQQKEQEFIPYGFDWIILEDELYEQQKNIFIWTGEGGRELSHELIEGYKEIPLYLVYAIIPRIVSEDKTT